jgi:hypothetical protein
MCERCFSGKPVKRRELLMDIARRKKEWAPKKVTPIVAFHGRRGSSSTDLSFLRLALPVIHGPMHGMKHRHIRDFGYAPTQSVRPLYWRWANRLHEALIFAACSHPQPFTPVELTVMLSEDRADRVVSVQERLPAREKVLRCIQAGAQHSFEVSAMTGMPAKSVSAWSSVLWQNGEIERIGEQRTDKHGRETYLYRVSEAM